MAMIEAAALDSNVFLLASFGILDNLKKLVEVEKPEGGEGEEEEETPTTEVDLNAKDERGCTPLAWAARNGHLEVVDYLIGKGADVNIASFGGMTPGSTG